MRTILPLLRRGALSVLVVLGSLLASATPAKAQDWTSIRGIRVVVQVRGKNKRNRERVGRAVRRRLVDAIGPLVPSRELDKARKKLKLKGRRASNPRNLARAGLTIGAEHIIDVYVKSKGRSADIRTRLVDVATAEIAFEERTILKNLKRQGSKHGREIGERLVERLQAITQAYGGSVTAPPPPAATATLPEATIKARPKNDEAPFAGSPDAPPPPAPPTSADPYAGIDDPVDPNASKTDEGVEWFSAGNRAAPSPTEDLDAPPPSPTGEATTSTFEPPRPTPSDAREFVRVGIGAGAGLTRRYTLATAQGSSSLSYTLDPLSLFALGFELIVPKVDVGLEISAAFRPVAYSIDRGSLGTAFPSGLLIDLGAAVAYHVDVIGEGRQAFRIIPTVGARLVVQSVEQHDSNVIPSATTVALVAGATARYPINEIFELNGGLSLGLILSYSETPLGSGDPNGGFTLGVDVGARVWVTPYLGIAFDNVVSYDTVGFSNDPERPLPPDEVGRLSDVSITILDVRSSVGVIFRF